MKLFCDGWSGIYTIAEMSSNHGGSLETALDIVEAANDVGVTCIKSQFYTADSMTIDHGDGEFDVPGGEWAGKNLYKLYKESETPMDWHEAISKKCEALGLDYLVSVYDPADVKELRNISVSGYKVASFELCSRPLLESLVETGKPIIVSCGMATVEEIARTYALLNDAKCRFALLHCVTSYPAEYAEMNLATISEMANHFDCPIGLSDHSQGVLTAVMAAALGAKLIERHFCLAHSDSLPDNSFSSDPTEMKRVLQAMRDAEAALGRPYELSPAQLFYRDFRRSIYAVKDIGKGELLDEQNIKAIRPGHGLDPWMYHDVIGRKATRNLAYGEPISEGDYSDDIHD